MRLWELEEGDEGPREDGGVQFAGARAAEAAHLAAAEAMQAEELEAVGDGPVDGRAEAPAAEGRVAGMIRQRLVQLPAEEQVREREDDFVVYLEPRREWLPARWRGADGEG